MEKSLIVGITLSQIEKLENSIVAADPYGEDRLINDLRNQVFDLTDKLRKNCGYEKRKAKVMPRFQKPAPKAKRHNFETCQCKECKKYRRDIAPSVQVNKSARISAGIIISRLRLRLKGIRQATAKSIIRHGFIKMHQAAGQGTPRTELRGIYHGLCGTLFTPFVKKTIENELAVMEIVYQHFYRNDPHYKWNGCLHAGGFVWDLLTAKAKGSHPISTSLKYR